MVVRRLANASSTREPPPVPVGESRSRLREATEGVLVTMMWCFDAHLCC